MPCNFLRFALVCLAFGTSAVLSAASKKTSPDLDGLKPGTKIDVII